MCASYIDFIVVPIHRWIDSLPLQSSRTWPVYAISSLWSKPTCSGLLLEDLCFETRTWLGAIPRKIWCSANRQVLLLVMSFDQMGVVNMLDCFYCFHEKKNCSPCAWVVTMAQIPMLLHWLLSRPLRKPTPEKSWVARMSCRRHCLLVHIHIWRVHWNGYRIVCGKCNDVQTHGLSLRFQMRFHRIVHCYLLYKLLRRPRVLMRMMLFYSRSHCNLCGSYLECYALLGIILLQPVISWFQLLDRLYNIYWRLSSFQKMDCNKLTLRKASSSLLWTRSLTVWLMMFLDLSYAPFDPYRQACCRTCSRTSTDLQGPEATSTAALPIGRWNDRMSQIFAEIYW